MSEEVNVMICDAARPNLTMQMISDCFVALSGKDGVMPVLPMKDTIYRSEDGKIITSTLRREELFAGQAPEVFRFTPYYEACKALIPDDIYTINGSSEPAILAGMKIAMIPEMREIIRSQHRGIWNGFREEK